MRTAAFLAAVLTRDVVGPEMARAHRSGRDSPPPTGDRRAAVEERRLRAAEEPLDVRLRTENPFPLLEVRNPIHGTGYLVLLPAFPSCEHALCTCTDFARRGLGTCKHIEAGYRWRTQHSDARPLKAPLSSDSLRSGLWRQIDRRLAARSRDTGPESLAWRWAGRLLFERPGAG